LVITCMINVISDLVIKGIRRKHHA
jgi:hypothetical protein